MNHLLKVTLFVVSCMGALFGCVTVKPCDCDCPHNLREPKVYYLQENSIPNNLITLEGHIGKIWEGK